METFTHPCLGSVLQKKGDNKQNMRPSASERQPQASASAPAFQQSPGTLPAKGLGSARLQGGTEQPRSAGRCGVRALAGTGRAARGSGPPVAFHRSSRSNSYKGEDALWSVGTSSSTSPEGAIAMANLLAALTPVRHH